MQQKENSGKRLINAVELAKKQGCFRSIKLSSERLNQ